MNVPKIKGTHTAMKSGMLAADAAYEALLKGEEGPLALEDYETKLKESWVWKELHEVRNIRPSFHKGLWAGILYSGIDTLLLKGRVPWTFKHGEPDYKSLKPLDQVKAIEYPKPDGIISFDLLESVSRTGTGHEENQPIHLKLKNGQGPQISTNLGVYGGPEQKFCPGNVIFT
jgi:electron-transferring-flavoprotein dehydrogenase